MSKVNQFLNSNLSVFLILGFHFIAWLALALVLDIHPDMADHWVWSRFLSGGYYEHPPMIAFTIKMATLIGGDNVLTLKTGAIVFSTLIMFLSYRVGILFFNRRTALIFLLILECVPFYSIGSIFWSIDHPFLFFWLSGMFFVGKYLKNGNVNWFLPLGVALGLGALSKYTTVLFPVCLLIWCVYEKNHRKLLLSPKVYLSAIIAILVIFPNLYWNYQNDWITFGFVVGKGLTGDSSIYNFLYFTGVQFVVFSIIYSFYFWINLLLRKTTISKLFTSTSFNRSGGSFLFITGLFPILFFSLSSLSGGYSDPSWANASYLSLFLLLARFIDKEIAGGKGKREALILASAFFIDFLLVAVIVLHIFMNAFSLTNNEFLFKVTGWPDTASQISEVLQRNDIKTPEYVIAREYQMASVLSLYIKNQPLPHSIEKPRRNQWSPVEKVLKGGAILVCELDECEAALADLKKRFPHPFLFLGKTAITHYTKKIRETKIYYMAGQ